MPPNPRREKSKDSGEIAATIKDTTRRYPIDTMQLQSGAASAAATTNGGPRVSFNRDVHVKRIGQCVVFWGNTTPTPSKPKRNPNNNEKQKNSNQNQKLKANNQHAQHPNESSQHEPTKLSNDKLSSKKHSPVTRKPHQ